MGARLHALIGWLAGSKYRSGDGSTFQDDIWISKTMGCRWDGCSTVIGGFVASLSSAGFTTLMLRESDESDVLDLKGFYLRRSVRILPVYFGFLTLVALLQVLTKFKQPLLLWVHLLTFTTNFTFVRNWLTGHTWSLSCEEQFYLLWPTFSVFLGLPAAFLGRERVKLTTVQTVPHSLLF